MPNSDPQSTPPEWTAKRIRELVQDRFDKRACWYQIKVAISLHAGKDVVGVAPTGMGKTLSFWIPLLMALEESTSKDKLAIVITPLNLLGKQNSKVLANAGLPSIAVTAENNTDETWKVYFSLLHAV
jgi:superfamily II DNA/RNA helicase